MKNNYQHLISLLKTKKEVVFGLLLQKKGSAPQVPGASAIFTNKGLLLGTLGGGILELEAEKLAMSLFKEKKNQIREIDYTADIKDGEGAICGGIASFVLDFNPIKSISAFEEMDQALEQQQSGYLITEISSATNKTEIQRHWAAKLDEAITIPSEIRIGFEKEKANKTAYWRNKEKTIFIEHLSPPPRLIIIGAGHIGQAMCHQGNLLGFNVNVVDNRVKYATPDLLPQAHQLFVHPKLSEAISKVSLSKNDYIIIATQGHKSDSEALESVIHSKVAYIGMIGSKRKIEQVKSDFIQRKITTEEQFNRIHAPIGLKIGSKTVQEIAISIAAELIQKRNQLTK